MQPVLAAPARGQARSWAGLAVWWGIGIGGLGALLLVGFWLASHGPRTAPVSRSPVPARPYSQQQEHYEIAIRDGRAAYERTNFAEALAQARAALAIKHDDPTASKLMNDAQAQLAVATRIMEDGRKFQEAMQAGRTALDRTNFAETMAQADLALGFKPGDLAAMKLKNDAQTQLASVTQMQEKEEKFQAAMQAGRAAFDRMNFAEAQTQADLALGFKNGDLTATKLKHDAQAQLAAAAQKRENERKYQEAMKQGQDTFDKKHFTSAVAWAVEALKYKPNDPSASKLNTEALKAEAQSKATELTAVTLAATNPPALTSLSASNNPPVRTNRPAFGRKGVQVFYQRYGHGICSSPSRVRPRDVGRQIRGHARPVSCAHGLIAGWPSGHG